MKISAISDTHQKHERIKIKQTDLLIHSGDFQAYTKNDLFKFLDWYKEQKAKYKILVAGNHEKILKTKIDKNWLKKYCEYIGIIYLQDEYITIEGYKIYGTPWSIGSPYSSYAFSDEDKELKKYWEKIPKDIDILISHQPAYKTLDRVVDKENNIKSVGSKTLLRKIEELDKLKLHIFGHIHQDRGVLNKETYLSVNASSYNHLINKIEEEIIVTI